MLYSRSGRSQSWLNIVVFAVVVRMQSEDDLISAISNLPIILEHTAASHAADIHESAPSTSQ